MRLRQNGNIITYLLDSILKRVVRGADLISRTRRLTGRLHRDVRRTRRTYADLQLPLTLLQILNILIFI